MRKLLFFSLLTILIGALTISSCKKDEETGKTEPAPVTSCFPDSYNGDYSGSGTLSGSPATINLTVTKLSCTSCKIDAGSVVENITSLEESKQGGYKGKDEDGNEASIQLDGVKLQVSTDEINFNGDKQ